MNPQVSSVITCPSCRKRYRWKSELAGRKVRCTCSHMLVMPNEEPIAVAPPAPPADEVPLGGMLAAAMSPGKSAVVSALEERADEKQPSRLRNRIVPITLLALGVPLSFVLWIVMGKSAGGPIVGAVLNLVAQAGVWIPLGLCAVFLVSNLFGVEFDELKLTLLKLAAICMGALALADLAYLHFIIASEYDFRTILIGFVIELAVCAVLTWYLFELEFNETILMTVVMIVPRVLLIFFLGKTLHESMLS